MSGSRFLRSLPPPLRALSLSMVRTMRKALPYIDPIGSWLMLAAGMYIVFYWLTIGDLL